MKLKSLFAVLLIALFSCVAIAAQDFASFRDHSWVKGEGRVLRELEDDLEPPCHQRILLADGNGRTLLIVNNIDCWPRLANVECGDTLRFQGEFIANSKGGLVHWTHPDSSGVRPGGWLKLVKDVSPRQVEAEIIQLPSERREYFAGRGPIAERMPAPVNDDWPDTGYWLSTNSNARHNRHCENYRKTRGYPCKKNEGRPCGKCGG